MTPKQLEGIAFLRGYLAEIGNQVRACREDRKLSLRGLSRELGIDHVVLTRVEHGQWVPSEEEADILADWMNGDDDE